LRFDELSYRDSYILLLLLTQLGKHGKGQDFACALFGYRKITFSIAEVRVSFLEVDRDRIM
jgi:hypothetical protein